MKRRWLVTALGVLAVSNAWVLIHVARNRSGPPDAELELTARELTFRGGRGAADGRDAREESRIVLTLRWQNTAPEYSGAGQDQPGWFDRGKLDALGFDVTTAAGAKDASAFYQKQRAREVFVALELDGPAWQQWLTLLDARLPREPAVAPEMRVDQRREIDRQTASRLVAVDAGLDAAALRRRYPDRHRVMILPGRARAIWDDARPAAGDTPGRAARVRGAITSLSVNEISVPRPLSGLLDARSAQPLWTYDGRGLRIQPPAYAASVRVGSQYEPWIANVTTLP